MITLDIPKVAIVVLLLVQGVHFVISALNLIAESSEGNWGALVGKFLVFAFVVVIALRIFGVW